MQAVMNMRFSSLLVIFCLVGQSKISLSVNIQVALQNGNYIQFLVHVVALNIIVFGLILYW